MESRTESSKDGTAWIHTDGAELRRVLGASLAVAKETGNPVTSGDITFRTDKGNSGKLHVISENSLTQTIIDTVISCTESEKSEKTSRCISSESASYLMTGTGDIRLSMLKFYVKVEIGDSMQFLLERKEETATTNTELLKDGSTAVMNISLGRLTEIISMSKEINKKGKTDYMRSVNIDTVSKRIEATDGVILMAADISDIEVRGDGRKAWAFDKDRIGRVVSALNKLKYGSDSIVEFTGYSEWTQIKCCDTVIWIKHTDKWVNFGEYYTRMLKWNETLESVNIKALYGLLKTVTASQAGKMSTCYMLSDGENMMTGVSIGKDRVFIGSGITGYSSISDCKNISTAEKHAPSRIVRVACINFKKCMDMLNKRKGSGAAAEIRMCISGELMPVIIGSSYNNDVILLMPVAFTDKGQAAMDLLEHYGIKNNEEKGLDL